MGRLRIALYHNLAPGGALRALCEIVRPLSRRHDVDLFESDRVVAARRDAGMDLAIEEYCRAQHVMALPDPPLASLRLGHAHALREMRQLERLEAEVASIVNSGHYDLAFIHPCRVRYTPSILRKLSLPTVFFMQEARRPTFEHPARARRRASWGTGANRMTRLLNQLSGEISEPMVVRSDRLAARAPGVYLLCNSYFSRERILASYGVDAHVCYLGVDPVVFRPAPGSSSRPTSQPIALSVGRLVPAKRHDLVIRAIARLPLDRRPELVIVGEGPHAGFEAFLTGLAADLRVRLRMITAAGDEDLADLYREADVTVCAAELEPFGLTALESIACGTPVVAVREGGFRESVDDGVTGLLVEPDDAGLAEGIRAVIDGVGRFAPDTLHADIVAAGWTWDACVERLEQHFWAALAGG